MRSTKKSEQMIVTDGGWGSADIACSGSLHRISDSYAPGRIWWKDDKSIPGSVAIVEPFSAVKMSTHKLKVSGMRVLRISAASLQFKAWWNKKNMNYIN